MLSASAFPDADRSSSDPYAVHRKGCPKAQEKEDNTSGALHAARGGIATTIGLVSGETGLTPKFVV